MSEHELETIIEALDGRVKKRDYMKIVTVALGFLVSTATISWKIGVGFGDWTQWRLNTDNRIESLENPISRANNERKAEHIRNIKVKGVDE